MDAAGGGGAKAESGGFRAGASLIGDSDTQQLATDLDGKGTPEQRAFYKQQIDVGKQKIVDKEKVEGAALRDAADFDAMKDATWTFNSDREYYHGWSEGDDIILLRRDPATGKRIKEVHPFDWYFFVTKEDYERIPEKKWAWLLRHHAWKIEPDEHYPEQYVRIYVRNPVKKLDKKRIFNKVGDPEWGEHWAVPFFLGERPHALRFPQDRDRWTDLHHAVNWCRRKGVEPLEADLTPKQRFLTDYDLHIQAKYRMGFFDLETDDSVGGFDNKEQARILSVAWEGDQVDEDPDDRGFLLLEEETDEAERELLLRFKRECIDKYDVIAAWNGGGFDFPVLINRFHVHGIRIDWRYHLFADPLPVFKRHYVRAGSDATSYALDSIGDKVLGMNKIDWRRIFRERHPGVTPTFLNLYRHDPELLEEYNRHDSTILRKLEQFTGFVMIEQLFCRIANGFPNDWNISTKIDQLLLKKGFKEGHHFRTRYWSPGRPEQYEGAFVFDPVVGMHKNVCAFDFKSLYPSMVRAFNISPETIVKEEDRKDFEPGELCRIPDIVLEREDADGNPVRLEKGGTTFRLDREGYISQMFERTLERRKKYTTLQGERLAVCGTTQDDLYLLYYRLAYSFKRLGLSFYGDMGNPRSRYYDTELAEAVTLAGQFFIKATDKYAQECGLVPLYGDTDSVYIQLAPDDEEWESEDARLDDLIARGDAFVEYCQERYQKILQEHNCNPDWNTVLLEFEDIHDKIFFVTKKRYAGREIFHKGERTLHVEVKGLEVMRSDTSQVARKLQQAVLDGILMDDLDADEMEEKIIKPAFERAASGNLSTEEVTISKGISKDPDRYKTRPLHVALAETIREHGREFYIGMKIEYVVTGTKPKLQGVLAEDFDEDPDARYEAEYYWDKVIFPPSLRILEVVYPDRDWQGFILERQRRRRVLVERYIKWFRDPKKVQKAIDQIRENKNGVLGPNELAELRRAPRVRILATR